MNNMPSNRPDNNEIPTPETAKRYETEPVNTAPETKKTAAILSATALLLLCVILLACADVPLALAESQTGEDRLAGIFITENYIEPGMPEIDVSIHGEIVIKEQEPERIYGIFNQDDLSIPVSFPGLEGFGIYNLRIQDETSQVSTGYCTSDDIFTDAHFTASDNENHMEASVYVPADRPCSYYFNPVYQQADGTLYLLPGSGITSDSLNGGSWSQSIAQSRSESFGGTEETESYRYTVRIVAADVPGDTELIFMNRENQVLQSMSGKELELLIQKETPRLEIPADVSYLILRQSKAGTGEFTHTLFDRGTESLEYMIAAEDTCLHPRSLNLVWN